MDPQYRQLKDFLQLYNVITEQCFSSCVDTMMTRKVEIDEVRKHENLFILITSLNNENFIFQNSCLLNCVDKFAKVNQRMMGTYVEVQSRINENRMREYEENLKKAEELAQQQQAEPPAIIETGAN